MPVVSTAKCIDISCETLDEVGSSYNNSTMHAFGFSLKERIFSWHYDGDDSKKKTKIMINRNLFTKAIEIINLLILLKNLQRDWFLKRFYWNFSRDELSYANAISNA